MKLNHNLKKIECMKNHESFLKTVIVLTQIFIIYNALIFMIF